MSVETQAAKAPIGPKALLDYLRDHPDGRFKSPAELAFRFALSEEFVSQVLEKAESRAKPKNDYSQKIFSQLYLIRKKFKRIRDDAVRHPTTFVVLTTLMAVLLIFVLSLIAGHSLINFRGVNLEGPGVMIPFLAVCLQMGLFVRRGMVRFALYGALAYWIVGGIPLALLEWSTAKGVTTQQRFALCLLIVAAHLAVSVIYAVAAATCSLFGEYRRVLRENRRVEQMSRQELLERLFQLQARMDMAKSAPDRKVRFGKITAFVKPRLLIAAAVYGVLFNLLSHFAVGPQLGTIGDLQRGMLPGFVPIAIGTCLSVLNLASNIWLGYVSPNLKTAVIVGVIFGIAIVSSQLMWPPPLERSLPTAIILLLNTFLFAEKLAFGVFGGIIGAIQTKTLNDLSIQRNDEASLIAEQLKIQWRLSENACSTSVMVVDVVRSTQMKDNSDPLEVEYSFRRFQQWIEDISVSHGGAVRSTAGDGAVVSFPACHNAFIAATEIQRSMPEFNQSWNRLNDRFRVRIGLHVGEVQGDLGKIQFAQVIDIAAHLQKLAPSGGVAVTPEIVGALGSDAFVPLAVKSDGRDVFLALNPTGL